jgi:polyketide cyclase/dehydrase/lipid transport protein
VRRHCEASELIDAAPEAVWAVVADVTRVGEWSGECRGCAWVAPSDRAAAGARFRGRNRRGGLRWSRVNVVDVADAPRELVWRTVPRFPYPDSVRWRVSIEPEGVGARVSESFDVLRLPRVMEWGISVALPQHNDRTSDLAGDLARLKALVERP